MKKKKSNFISNFTKIQIISYDALLFLCSEKQDTLYISEQLRKKQTAFCSLMEPDNVLSPT